MKTLQTATGIFDQHGAAKIISFTSPRIEFIQSVVNANRKFDLLDKSAFDIAKCAINGLTLFVNKKYLLSAFIADNKVTAYLNVNNSQKLNFENEPQKWFSFFADLIEQKKDPSIRGESRGSGYCLTSSAIFAAFFDSDQRSIRIISPHIAEQFYLIGFAGKEEYQSVRNKFRKDMGKAFVVIGDYPLRLIRMELVEGVSFTAEKMTIQWKRFSRGIQIPLYKFEEKLVSEQFIRAYKAHHLPTIEPCTSPQTVGEEFELSSRSLEPHPNPRRHQRGATPVYSTVTDDHPITSIDPEPTTADSSLVSSESGVSAHD